MKKCNKCGIEKPLNSFYINKNMTDNHYNACKSCRDEYDKTRAKDRKKYFTEYKRKYRIKNKEKILAHYAVSSAVKRGKLIRQSCEVCGKEKTEAHHDDYSKRLEVRWLCRVHHVEHHKLND